VNSLQSTRDAIERPPWRADLTECQTAFLKTVMLHSGVFVGRQYAAFAGITHGQKVHDFIEKLLTRRLVTAIELGSTGRTRIFHHLRDDEYPRLVFGKGPNLTVRYFPDKLPIGYDRDHRRHVFMYLARHRGTFRVEGSRDDAERRAPSVRADDEAADRGAAGGAASARTASALRWNGKAAHAEGQSGARPTNRQTGEREAGDSDPAAHVLFASGDAWSAGKGDSGTGRTPGPGHDSALHALESGGARCGDSVARWSG
jgi:hypothetical protein